VLPALGCLQNIAMSHTCTGSKCYGCWDTGAVNVYMLLELLMVCGGLNQN
jgi:hypothetical protein